MVALTEQEHAQQKAWRQRQAAPSTLPEYTPAEKENASGEDGEQFDEEKPELESVEEMDQAEKEMNKIQLDSRKKAALKQSAASEEKAQAEGETGAGGGSSDNIILFAASLFLAGIKDLLDFLSLGTLGTFINIFISGAFAIILLMRGSKLNKSKTLVRYIAAAIIEFIPFLNFIPTWTLSVLWEKLEKKLPASMQVAGKAAGDGNEKQPTKTTDITSASENSSDNEYKNAA